MLKEFFNKYCGLCCEKLITINLGTNYAGMNGHVILDCDTLGTREALRLTKDQADKLGKALIKAAKEIK